MKEVFSLSPAKFDVLSDSVSRLGKMNQNPLSSIVWDDKLTWFKSSAEYRVFDFECQFFQGYHTLQFSHKVQEFISTMSEPSEFTGPIIFMSMFNDISYGSQDNEQDCELIAQLVSIGTIRFSPGRLSFLGSGTEKKCFSTHESKPKENGTELQR